MNFFSARDLEFMGSDEDGDLATALFLLGISYALWRNFFAAVGFLVTLWVAFRVLGPPLKRVTVRIHSLIRGRGWNRASEGKK